VDIKKDNVCYSETEDKIKIVDVDRQFFNELGLKKGQIISNLQKQLISVAQQLTSLQQELSHNKKQKFNVQNQSKIQDLTDKIQDLNKKIQDLVDRFDIANNLIDKDFPYYYPDYKTHLINYMIFQTVLVGKRFVQATDLLKAGLTEISVTAMLQFLLDTNNYFTSISEYHTPVDELSWYARRVYKKDYIKTAFFNEGVDRMYRFITNPAKQPMFGGGRRRTIRRKLLRNKKSRKNGKK
jgi:hypothetical protein